MRRILLIMFVLSMIGTIFALRSNEQPTTRVKIDYSNLPKFTLSQIKPFDGRDPGKPIYLAMDGLVYDVTPGREFYQPGAPYHYLAGKDSSGPLHLVGGSTIKRKYKVIGVLKT